MIPRVPPLRVRSLGGAGERQPGAGEYVLYWMVAQRRARWNFALQHAAGRAQQLGKPLVVLEALRVGHPHASDRFHHFVIDGMADNAARFAAAGVRYLAYVEREPEAGKGLLTALAARACLVVSDDWPCFFVPRMQIAAARQISAPLELVDGNGIIPLRAADSAFSTAHAFRRFIQKHGAEHLAAMPLADPLVELGDAHKPSLPAIVRERWPMLRAAEIASDRDFVAELPIDHTVGRAPLSGGSIAGERTMDEFLRERLDAYDEDHNDPDREATSGLSPWLHFGHVGAHQLVAAVLEREGWDPSRLGDARPTMHSTPRCRAGHERRSPSTAAIFDPIATRCRPSRPRTPATRSGTQRSASCWLKVAFTIICACCGARRSSSGAPAPSRRSIA